MSLIGKWFDELAINQTIKIQEGANPQKYIGFEQFVNLMKDKLDRPQWYAPIAYTPHDFSHHVKTVLHYGSKILEKALGQLSTDDLLVFQYACVLHDLDMVYNPYGREIHSYSANQILDEFAGEHINNAIQKLLADVHSSLFDIGACGSIPSNVQQELVNPIHASLSQFMEHLIEEDAYREAIGQIILGHSDIKYAGGKIDTLAKEFYTRSVNGSIDNQKIKTRILSATLRFADELDCSKRRIEGIKHQVIPPEGRKYWDRLKLISNVDISIPNIRLEIDCDYIRRASNRNICYEWLHEVYEKINSERVTVMQCYVDDGLPLNIAEVSLLFTDDTVKKEYDQFVEQKKNTQRHNLSSFDVDELRKSIRERIDEKGLLREVHHYISGMNCGIRNHLDCNGLLTDQTIIMGITRAFINSIYTQSFSEEVSDVSPDTYLLVGVANSGVLLASRIAMITGLPMIYYVPPRKNEQFTEHEKNWKEQLTKVGARKAILILGVNVTGESINNVQTFLRENSPEDTPISIHSVLGVVNRNMSCPSIEQLKENGVLVNFLLEEYPIDWCSYSERDCPYKRQCRERVQEAD